MHAFVLLEVLDRDQSCDGAILSKDGYLLDLVGDEQFLTGLQDGVQVAIEGGEVVGYCV